MWINIRLFIVVFVLLRLNSFAQEKYSSGNPRAIRYFQSALSNYNAREDEKALSAIEEAIKADTLFIEPWLLKGNIFTDNKNAEKAVEAYKRAVQINPDFFPNTYYSLGKLEFTLQRYDEAYSDLEKFTGYPKVPPNLLSNAKRYMASCRFAQTALNNPVKFEPVNMGASINSAALEYFPAITADGATFLFTRRQKTPSAGGKVIDQEDFYVSKKKDAKWQAALPLDEINTTGNEGAPALSADGQYLFFTACEELFVQTNARATKGSCDLFIAKKIGDKFMNPRNLEEPVNSGSWESQPSFSSDGRTLYFIRAVKGADGKTQRDIFVTHINDNSSWSTPAPLSQTINTPNDEMSVFIHPDDQTLYFSSDGHPGMGGLDIFMSRKTPTGDWGEPVNLGYPINTSKDENSLLVSPDGQTGYFSSDRAGGFGGLDLYQFSLDENLRPRVVTYMKGKVYDEVTNKPLSAGFELIDLENNKTVVSSTSNPGNGEYLVCLPTGRRYALNVSKDGYLFYSENFELKDPKRSNDPVIRDVPMKPIKVGESVVLKNIFFEFNKFDLKEESKTELSKVILFMTKNPSMKIEIGGHTDNVGSAPYNQQLSEKRAKSVMDYLVTKGVAVSRLSYKGYGDKKPMADNGTEEGRAQNRRTEFTILSVN